MARRCHHEQTKSTFHSGIGMLASFMGVMDAGVQDELGAEETDPTYTSDPNHDAHTHTLQTADQGMKGATFAMGFLDSVPGMIDSFRGAPHI